MAKTIDYADAYLNESESGRTTFVYRAGMNVYEEGLEGGIYYAMGWLGAGYVPQQISEPAVPRMDYLHFREGQAFSVGADGAQLVSHWTLAGYEKEETAQGLRVTVRLAHQLAPVAVAVVTLLDGTGVLTRHLEIENRGEGALRLSELSILSGGLQATPRFRCQLRSGQALYRLGYMECANWGLEGAFRWHDLPSALYGVRGKFGRDRHRHPMFVLENNATGEHFICQLGHSGGWRFEFDLDEEITAEGGPGGAFLALRVALDGFAPLHVLRSGERLVSPQVHIGMSFGDLDEAVNEMNRHIRRSVMPPRPGWNSPIECGIGPEMDMSQEAVLRSIDYAARHGAECFILDAGWFWPGDAQEPWGGYIGDWRPKIERYAMGIDAIRELCHRRGMKFGLWMEAERALESSRVWREHKDWFANDYRTPLSQREAAAPGPLALENPEVFDWLGEEIERLVARYQLDLFRLDYNAYKVSYRLSGDVLASADWQYQQNLYALLDELRRKHPHLLIENCASGGGRSDLGMLARADHTWVTDWQHAPRSFLIGNGMTMCLPPEYVDRLIGAQSGHREGDFDFQARLLLFGRPTFNAATVCGRAENPAQAAKLDRVLDLYRRVVRPMHADCRVYHHTPELDPVEPKGLGILELADGEGRAAVIGVFALAAAGEAEAQIRFRGLDIGRDYRLTMDNAGKTARVAGFVLMNEGVRVRLGGALKSELLVAEAE